MRVAPRFRSSVVAVATAAAGAALVLPGAALAARPTARVEGRVLAAAHLPFGTRVLGVTPSSQRVRATVILEPRSARALAAFAAAVSDRHSVQFHHYLGRGRFASRFGPTTASIHRVESFLRAEGLTVDALSSNHLDLAVSGTAGSFSTAFATRLSQVRLPDGTVGRATTAPVALAPSIAASVLAVIGLSNVLRPEPATTTRLTAPIRPTHHGLGRAFPTARPRAIAGAPSACVAASASTQLGFGGVTDDQIAQAYGADGLYAAGDLGHGQTVAIFEQEPFSTADVKAFEECYFGADHTGQITTVNVDHGPGTGFGVEAELDIEDVAALAPAANIAVYQAPPTSYGSLDAYNKIVSDDTARVVTSSWGFCETDQLSLSPGATAAENLIFEQAASQGQTVFNSSGDSGNDGCSYQSNFPSSPVLSVGDPASQPYVVGVGGTTAITVSQPPKEQVWNDGAFGGAGGGGVSAIWEQPPWLGATADALSSAAPCHASVGEVCRTVPDVSAFADPYTGVTVYIQGTWGTIGGTSSSSPIWAAMLALINASSTCTSSLLTANGVGFAAPLLYQVASNATDYASGFNDVTAGNNDVFNLEHGKYPALTGYDLATGLGSPQLTPAPHAVGPGLATSLCDAAQGTTTAHVASIAPTSGSAAGGTPFTITGTGFFHSGIPDVSHVAFGTSPAASFTVVSDTEITGTTSAATTPTTSSRLRGVTKGTGGAMVTVTTTDGEVAVGPTFHYVVLQTGKTVPTVLQLGPTGGTAAGGTTVQIYGSGFTGATKVTFGGAASPKVTFVSDVQLEAVTPKLTTSAVCFPGSTALGVCQAQVRVTGPGGTSSTVAAKKPYTGFLNFNQLGEILVSPRCGCEAYPSITEYDYTTSYGLTKITGGGGRPFVGDPNGGDLALLDGHGMNVLTLNWVEFGPTGPASSIDGQLIELNRYGTQAQVVTVADQNPSTTGNSVPVELDTVSGLSNSKSFAYASIPKVTGLSTGVLPSGGGTTLTITGGGFTHTTEVGFVPFSPVDPPVVVLRNFTVDSATQLTLPSPSMLPASYIVVVCDQYTCNAGDPTTPVTSTVDVIYPGETAVTSAEGDPGGAQPIMGPTTGGTTFEVQGTNFGPLAHLTVYLENPLGEMVAASAPVAGPAPTDPGATETVVATAPPSIDGLPEQCDVVLVGDNGTSSLAITSIFQYTP
jgi:hypothetical protein